MAQVKLPSEKNTDYSKLVCKNKDCGCQSLLNKNQNIAGFTALEYSSGLAPQVAYGTINPYSTMGTLASYPTVTSVAGTISTQSTAVPSPFFDTKALERVYKEFSKATSAPKIVKAPYLRIKKP